VQQTSAPLAVAFLYGGILPASVIQRTVPTQEHHVLQGGAVLCCRCRRPSLGCVLVGLPAARGGGSCPYSAATAEVVSPRYLSRSIFLRQVLPWSTRS